MIDICFFSNSLISGPTCIMSDMNPIVLGEGESRYGLGTSGGSYKCDPAGRCEKKWPRQIYPYHHTPPKYTTTAHFEPRKW